ncbi:hypothetical protein [Paraburkholderia sp. J12]|uniref:hypothetical protein n=1 Tax=Paraburkholderia sp. J12 TaxID=2805432 RepID=UPI002ABD42F3|nr:hypothetical protein [Paraburkholderia sp. J12]
MSETPRLLHDRDLFEAVLVRVRELNPIVREGAVFGYPAIFLGHRVVLCVYGSGIGIRLPPDYAQRLVDAGLAFHFQPYGRSTMREWVEMRVARERLDQLAPVFSEAIRFVETVDGDTGHPL